mgnify:FL=1
MRFFKEIILSLLFFGFLKSSRLFSKKDFEEKLTKVEKQEETNIHLKSLEGNSLDFKATSLAVDLETKSDFPIPPSEGRKLQTRINPINLNININRIKAPSSSAAAAAASKGKPPAPPTPPPPTKVITRIKQVPVIIKKEIETTPIIINKYVDVPVYSNQSIFDQKNINFIHGGTIIDTSLLAGYTSVNSGLIGGSSLLGANTLYGLNGISGISSLTGLTEIGGLHGLTGMSGLGTIGGIGGINGSLYDSSTLIGSTRQTQSEN